MADFKKRKTVKFLCNICGTRNRVKMFRLSREIPTCSNCHSTIRMRSIIHLLSLQLFGESIILPEFPIRKDVHGIGMSDWIGYAKLLSQKLSYINTYYHKEPYLDISKEPDKTLIDKYDFIISSDVFEHVNPPVSIAFSNMKQLLKDDGFVVFTVPYTKEGTTKEHFPQLNKYSISRDSEGHYLLNVTKTGEEQIYRELVFHGGDGETLEMRIFSEESLIEEFKQAGFKNVHIFNNNFLQYGIYWEQQWSLPIIAW